jgi:hypothetical protein
MTIDEVKKLIGKAVLNSNYIDRSPNEIADAILTALEAKGCVIEQGWQPIETAPKDGTRVLLAVKPADTVDNWYGRTPPDVDGFGLFKHLDNGWSTPGSGGWADFFFSGWRPLPERPLAARGE